MTKEYANTADARLAGVAVNTGINEPIECSQLFKNMYEAVESDPEYWAEGMGIEILETLYVRMQSLGMRQSDLADKLKVSRQWIGQFFAGKGSPTLRTIARVAIALGMRPRLILRNEDKICFKVVDK